MPNCEQEQVQGAGGAKQQAASTTDRGRGGQDGPTGPKELAKPEKEVSRGTIMGKCVSRS